MFKTHAGEGLKVNLIGKEEVDDTVGDEVPKMTLLEQGRNGSRVPKLTLLGREEMENNRCLDSRWSYRGHTIWFGLTGERWTLGTKFKYTMKYWSSTFELQRHTGKSDIIRAWHWWEKSGDRPTRNLGSYGKKVLVKHNSNFKDTHDGLILCMFDKDEEMSREANTEFGLDG